MTVNTFTTGQCKFYIYCHPMSSKFTTWQYYTAKRRIRRNNNINETIIFLMGGGGGGYLQSPNKTNTVYVYI